MDPFNKMFGWKEYGRAPAIAAPLEPQQAPAAAAEPTASDVVAREPITPTHSVSVILPVYRGIEMTRRCIEAAMPGVLAMEGAVLLAINDGSPDQGMQAMLESLLASWPGRFEVLENPVNLGFVGTVNRGLAHFAAQDVVLLNSDVIVPADWLQRLQAEAYSHPRVGTVTPFSNNATICSFPNFLEENAQAFNLDVHDLAMRRGAHRRRFLHVHPARLPGPDRLPECGKIWPWLWRRERLVPAWAQGGLAQHPVAEYVCLP
jgi:glycosyltransferase involved in cell wall biosynthesis